MKRFTSIAALTAFLITSAACSDASEQSTETSSSPTSSPSTATSPETTGPAVEYPTAIVSLAPALTEILFAIGAGPQVIAVDEYSNFPAEALGKPHDLSGFEPSVEAIAALQPDLVVASEDTAREQLEALGITVWVGPAASTFDDVYTQIEQLGAATGHLPEAVQLVAQMQSDIEAAVASVTVPPEGLRYYHELDPTLYSLTSNTFAGQVYALFGLTNIADGAQEGNDYPQLNPEYIVQANPDLVFLADTKCCSETAATVAAREGWAGIAAVANGNVFELDDDIASRWGPRIVDFVKAVAAALQQATVAG